MSRFRSVNVAVVLALALTVAACAPGPAAPPVAPPPAPPTPALDWTDCGDGFQCTTIEVPKDWNAPESLSRINTLLWRRV